MKGTKQLGARPLSPEQIKQSVLREVQSVEVDDVHTHLFPAQFGKLMLSGIDELLVYHYLIAEGFRYWEMPYDTFWRLTKEQQADLVWETLFVQRAPISEAARGVVTVLHRLGLDPAPGNLNKIRRWFAQQKPEAMVERVLKLARVKTVYMANSPFDLEEVAVWRSGWHCDERFPAALRIDPLVLDWPNTAALLQAQGYRVSKTLTPGTISGIRKFLADWTKLMSPRYLMISLPPTFHYTKSSMAKQIIDRCILPHCLENDLPFAMMPGVIRQINPTLRLAGDGVGRVDLTGYATLMAEHPKIKFLLTVLSRENQHELCVLARKLRNLHVFGCWWFTNIPSMIEEMTQMRIELLGLSVTLQHSDARVLEQLVYKWEHSRQIIGEVMSKKFIDLSHSGWPVNADEIKQSVACVFGNEFNRFINSKA
jgi:hypothetical protein